jgi:anti-sigma factor RsiW
MNCKQAEKFLLRSSDGRLGAEDSRLLKSHLEGCPRCRDKAEEYRLILSHLKPEAAPEPLPYFEQRLLAKIEEREKAAPAQLWLRWAHRAAAFSLAAFLLFGAGVLLFQPREPVELSQVETLFLQNENPLSEAATILDQKKAEDRNMMLIFAASDARDLSRRYTP